MKDNVDHDRRKVLAASAAVLTAPMLGMGAARAGEAESSSRRTAGEITQKSPERVAEVEAGIALGAEAEAGPAEIFSPVGIGDEVRDGWRLTEVRAPEKGAMLVVLSRDGVMARVHVCANGGCAVGPASTDELDFLVMNDGQGSLATAEDLGLALRALAELAGATGVVPSDLLTHEQRIEKYLSAEPGALL
ncbi:MAG: hypothetical protein KDA24_04310 [Deltaproteobacteria bacterium]|nr:hypothetical protein [Deltaproteobacteria bacterium]